jgi:hypothetical protein
LLLVSLIDAGFLSSGDFLTYELFLVLLLIDAGLLFSGDFLTCKLFLVLLIDAGFLAINLFLPFPNLPTLTLGMANLALRSAICRSSALYA